MTKFQELYDFIDRAKKNRKYPEATAGALKAALKLYDAELSDEERSSLDKVKKDFEQITQSVFKKNANKFSASSLITYKSRILKVFADYEKYGDPAKMSNWFPKIIARTKKSSKSENLPSRDEGEHDEVDHPHTFLDKGNGWVLTIRSKNPISSEIKKSIIDVSDKLDKINKDYENT